MQGKMRFISRTAACVFFLILSFGETAQASPPGENSHATCILCHRIPEYLITEENPFPEAMDPSGICLDCHHYTENHHPVNFIPQDAGSDNVFNSFPLFNGEMRCLTCHEAHKKQGNPSERHLLRGGPYAFRTEFCFRCHRPDLNTFINPHKMLTDEGEIREINGEPVCLMCHTNTPDQTNRSVEISFKADVAFLCWRCHPPMSGDFFNNHFLVKPRKKTLKFMKKVEREKGVIFPLLNRDRITCSTCHNPHQEGVISYGPASAGADVPNKIRLDRDLCAGCHKV